MNLAVVQNGTVRSWGENGYPPPADLTGVKQLAGSFSFSLALLSNGTVRAWGANYYGAVDVPAGLSNVIAVATGHYHALAIKADGSLVSWGGQDGISIIPPGLGEVKAIAGGGFHTVVLRKDGTVAAWGWNAFGQATVPTGLNDVIAVSAGDYHSMALKADGTVVVWGGQDPSIQPPPGLSHVKAISAGGWHNLALTEDGQVIAWGADSRGQIAVPTGLRDVIAISAGGMHNLILSSSSIPLIQTQPQSVTSSGGATASFSVTAVGTAPLSYQWEKDGSALPGAVASTLTIENLDGTNAGAYSVVVANAVGSVTSAPAVLTMVGLTSGSALVNLDGPDVPDSVTDIISVDAGDTHALAIKADGSLVSWGQYPATLIPAGVDHVSKVAVDRFSSIALRTDGTMVTWAVYGAPAGPSGLTDIVDIAAGPFFGLAVRSNGTVVSWGSIGLGPAGLSDVVAVDAGDYSAVALKRDGTVFTWGLTYPGGYYSPAFYDIHAISMGRNYLLALRNDGTVAGSGVPSGLSNVVAIAAGGNYGLALKSDGSLVGWGAAPDTSGVTNATFINARGGYSLVVTRWPVITRQPRGEIVQPGDSYTFSVKVRGAGPFTYQWKKDGTNIPGARAASLVLSNVGNDDLGSYSVVVGNTYGTIESLHASLAFFGPPSITRQPLKQTVFAGAKVGFSVSALGRNPLSYQWYHNGTPVPGQSAAALLIANATSTDAGAYTVTVSNQIAAVESQSALLTITEPPVWQHSSQGTVISIAGPAVPLGLTNVVAVAAGMTHGLALRSDGSVVGWGRVLYGQLAVPDGLTNVVAISAGDTHSVALRSDGTVVSWGGEDTKLSSDLYGIVGIAAGNQHTLFLKSDGSVLSYRLGNFSSGPASASNCVSIDAGSDSDVALRSDGTVATWGFLLNPGGFNPVGLSNITSVSLADRYLLALQANGIVVGAGVPAGLSNVVSIAAGWRGFGLALIADGSVRGWGGLEPPVGLSGVSAIAAGGFGLLITTNPPLPTLAAQLGQTGQITLTTPLSVSGYILEGAPGLSQPFVEVPSYTNSFALTNDSLGFQFSTDAQSGIYRLRKK